MKHLIACLTASSFLMAAPVGLPGEVCGVLAGNEAAAAVNNDERLCGAPAEKPAPESAAEDKTA